MAFNAQLRATHCPKVGVSMEARVGVRDSTPWGG